MKHYDELMKHLMDRFADEFARLAFMTLNVKVLETLDTEQPTIKVHRNDMTYKVRWNDEEVLLHIEAQTQDSRDKPMPLRMLAYASALMLRHELPVYSLVLYLSPNAGHKDPGGYHFGDDTFGLQYNYKVLRLVDLEGEAFLDASSVGLLPFTPLMKPPAGMGTEAWLQKCVETTQAASVDPQTRGTLLFALSIFGSLAHDPIFFQKPILEAMMQESPFYEIIIQRGVEQGKEIGIEQGKEMGIEQGARENCVTNILSVLTKRFPQSDVQPVSEVLESVLELNRLTELLHTAIDTPSVDTFLQALNGSQG